MNLKNEVIRNITAKFAQYVSSEQLSKLEGILILSLHDYQISKQETALSTNVEIPNEKYLRQFLAIKKIGGLSEKTLRCYRQEIQYFFRHIIKPIREITTDDIRFYLAGEQMDKNITSVTLDNKLRCLRSFFKTLRVEGFIQADPTEKVTKVKTPKVIKKPFSDEELEILRNYSTEDKRTKALVEVFASTGCRVGEISNANISDIKDSKILITGKGNKQRYVYLTARAKLALEEYLSTRQDQEDALFIGYRKNCVGQPQRLQVGRIEQIIRELGRSAGVENCHCHRFRRTMATQALKSGMPIEQVSMLLGHEELTTTQIYARSDEEDIQMAHKKYVK